MHQKTTYEGKTKVGVDVGVKIRAVVWASRFTSQVRFTPTQTIRCKASRSPQPSVLSQNQCGVEAS